MQDKQNEYIDHAWEEMRKLLDQEMPVRRRQRIGWWWIGAAGLLALLWTGWYIWSHKQAEDAEVVDASAKKMGRLQSEHNPVPGDNLPLSPRERSSIVTGRALQVPPRLPSVKESSTGPKPQASEKKGQGASVENGVPVNNTQNSVVHEERAVSGVDWVQRNPPVSRTSMEAIMPLPRIERNNLVPAEQTPDTSLFAIAWPAKTSWSFGVELAMILDNRAGITGGFSGLTAAWRQGRWSVHSGLDWVRQDLSSLQGDFVNESLLMDAPNPNLAPEGSRIPQLPSSLDVRSSQLRIPFFLSYHLSPKWSIGLGVHMRYWLQAQQQWSYGTDLDPKLQLDATESFGALLGRAGDQLSTTVYRRWDVAPMVQLTFSMHEQWQLGMGARLGVKDMSKIDHIRWYDHSLWAVVRRTF